MSNSERGSQERTAVKPRLRRAVCECHTVLDLGGDCFEVVSESGNTYGVDLAGENPVCTCADFTHNGVDECKHIMRCRVLSGEKVIPPAIPRDEIDPLLGTAFGVAVHAGAAQAQEQVRADGGEIDRPADCSCGEIRTDVSLPCWPCYRDGILSRAGEEEVVATDGGSDVMPPEERPADCTCTPPSERSDGREIPCWQCWDAGADHPNPAAGERED